MVTDIRMADMDGNELIRQLRRRDPVLPIVAITGHATDADRKDILETGATVVLSKPVRPSKIARVLSNIRTENDSKGQMD